MTPVHHGFAASLQEAADSLGFSGGGRAPYRLGGMSLRAEGNWVLLTSPETGSNPLGGEPDQLGLWRSVAEGPAGPTTHVFEITPAMFGSGSVGATVTASASVFGGASVPASSWRAMLDWALATHEGRPPRDWRSPDRSDVASWIPRASLTVSAGDQVRQGRVIHSANRLAIEFPLVTSVPPDLPPSRLAWLDSVLIDAQRTWHLAKVVRALDGSVWTSADLTGAPAELMPTISRAALDALRWVTSWVVPPVALITDLSLESRLLDAAPPTARLATADVL